MAEALREFDDVDITAGQILSDAISSLVTVDKVPEPQESPAEEIIYLKGNQLIIPNYALPEEAVSVEL